METNERGEILLNKIYCMSRTHVYIHANTYKVVLANLPSVHIDSLPRLGFHLPEQPISCTQLTAITVAVHIPPHTQT